MNDSDLLDKVERGRRRETFRTQRRRRGRQLRRRTYGFIGMAVAFAAVIAAPSVMSYGGVWRSIITSRLADAGWSAEIESVRLGWITPLTLRSIEAAGPSGRSQIAIADVQAKITLWDYFRGELLRDWGTIAIDGVTVQTDVYTGGTTIEDDVRRLMSDQTDGASPSFNVVVDNVRARLKQSDTQRVWQMDSATLHIASATGQVDASMTGIVTDDRGNGGELHFKTGLKPRDATGTIDVTGESLPASLLTLVQQRMTNPESSAAGTVAVGGDITGSTSIDFGPGRWAVSFDPVEMRELQTAVADQTATVRLTNHVGAIRGRLWSVDGVITAENFAFDTDFAHGGFDGRWTGVHRGEPSATTIVPGSMRYLNELLAFMRSVDGRGQATIDLARLQTAMPGLMRGDRNASVDSGEVRLTVRSQPDRDNGTKSDVNLSIKNVAAVTEQGRRVAIGPMTASTQVKHGVNGDWYADSFEFASQFGTARGGGHIEDGEITFDIDINRLVSEFEPLMTSDRSPASGRARGRIGWQSDQTNRWRLEGDANLTDFAVGAESNVQTGTVDLIAKVNATGTMRAGRLVRLDEADAELKTGTSRMGVMLAAPLDEPMSNQTANRELTLDWLIEGSAAELIETLRRTRGLDWRSYAPAGTVKLDGSVGVRGNQIAFTAANLDWQNPRLTIGGTAISQERLEGQFEGRFQWDRDVTIDHAHLRSSSFSLAAEGHWANRPGTLISADSSTVKLNRVRVKVNAELDRLSRLATASSVPPPAVPFRGVAPRGVPFRTVSAGRPDRTSLQTSRQIGGTVRGEFDIRSDERERWTVRGDIRADDFGVYQQASNELRTVWFEPTVDVTAIATMPEDPTHTQAIYFPELSIASDWITLNSEAGIEQTEQGWRLAAKGPAKYDSRSVADKLTALTGTSVVARGVHTAEVQLSVDHRGVQTDWRADTSVGWDAASIGGLTFGSADVPVVIENDRVRIDRSVIPTGGGSISPAATVYYGGPVRIEVDPGVIATDVELTRELTASWLRYVAPVMADATGIDGVVGVTLDASTIRLDQPDRSEVSGVVDIRGATMTAGPMVDNLLVGVDNARRLAGSLSDREVRRTGRTLVEMPPQQVAFDFRRGVVTHQRMFFTIDRAGIMTSGRVTTDGRLDMVAQMLIEESWVGRDLGSLAGRRLTLPIGGTLDDIRVDTSAVGRLLTQAVIQAGQEKAQSFVDEQLQKGLGRLLGK